MNRKPLISIIIPVYKVEDYIHECISSAINQTYKNLEIILVDDASPDKCPQICDDYSKKNSRIRVIHKIHSGLSETRNAGLEICNGEYVYFLDSDDYLEEDAIESLLSEAQYHSADVVFFDSKVIRNTNKLDYPSNFYIRESLYSEPLKGINMLSNLLKNGEFFAAVPLLFMQRNLLVKNNLSFYPGIVHEDELFTFKLFLYSNKAVHLREPLYNRRIRDNSIMTGKIGAHNFISIIIVATEMINVYLNEIKWDKSKDVDVIREHIRQFLTIIDNRYSQLSFKNKIVLFERYKELICKIEAHDYLNSQEIKEKCLSVKFLNFKKEVNKLVPRRIKRIIKKYLYKDNKL